MNPFATIESYLAEPHADGLMLTDVGPDSHALRVGLKVGDILVTVDGASIPDLPALLKAVQSGAAAQLSIVALRPGGERLKVSAPRARLGVHGVAVKKGHCAWHPPEDCSDAPDFSAFAKNGEIWLKTHFGEAPAGYERIFVRRDGDRVTFDHLTQFGGGTTADDKWHYRAQSVSTHRLDATLSVVDIDWLEGTPAEGQKRARFSLGQDGVWTGTAEAKNSPSRTIRETAAAPLALNVWSIPLLALTMPLRAGASRTFPELSEWTARIRGRSRMVCEARETITVAGASVDAWRFGWIHYGEKPEHERFYVTPDRRLVRLDWGADYGGCWCEASSREGVAVGIPGHVPVE